MEQKYQVLAAGSQTDLETHGSDVDSKHDVLTEAKARARYYLTEEYRLACESTQRLGYAQVINISTGAIVADYFA